MKILFSLILVLSSFTVSSQVKVRLFSGHSPQTVVLTVTGGNYEMDAFAGDLVLLETGEIVVIAKYGTRLAVRTRNSYGFICDSLEFTGRSNKNSFSIRLNEEVPVKQNYSGSLWCFPDLGSIVLINKCDIEEYISGVVKAEGGSGKNIEYFKSQAVIARTYLYKYFNKHLGDKYNVCDNTHCQAFNGISTDSVINKSALETRGLVILDHDSALIISAFHSNCGGETSSSLDVWLTDQPYLKSIKDPYCLNSRNAVWEMKIPLINWIEYLKKHGYKEKAGDPSTFNFVQDSRLTEYKTGLFGVPLRNIRNDLNLRSTFFSVTAENDTIYMKGRGYGHGVGLCQEGAMSMANKGFTYQQIISFYYYDVFISDIKNAVVLPQNSPQIPVGTQSLPKGG